MVKPYNLCVHNNRLSETTIFTSRINPEKPAAVIHTQAMWAIKSKFILHEGFSPTPEFYYELSHTIPIERYIHTVNTHFITNYDLDFFRVPVAVEHRYDLDEIQYLATVNICRIHDELIVYEPVFIDGFKIYKV